MYAISVVLYVHIQFYIWEPNNSVFSICSCPKWWYIADSHPWWTNFGLHLCCDLLQWWAVSTVLLNWVNTKPGLHQLQWEHPAVKGTDLSPSTNVCPCLLRVLYTVPVQHMHLLYVLKCIWRASSVETDIHTCTNCSPSPKYILFKHFISVMLALLHTVDPAQHIQWVYVDT